MVGLRSPQYSTYRLLCGKISQADHLSLSPAWSKHGVVGRGILLDVHTYLLKNPSSPQYDPFETNSITLSTLLAVANAQNTTIKHGDILFIRSGYTTTFNKKTPEELQQYVDRGQPPQFGGVEQSEEILEWIWANFSAVAGDQPSFECWRMCFLPSLPYTPFPFPYEAYKLAWDIELIIEKHHKSPISSMKSSWRAGVVPLANCLISRLLRRSARNKADGVSF